MSPEDVHEGRTEEPPAFAERPALISGALSGFIATLATALPIAVMDLSLLEDTIAGMYGFEGVLVVGLLAHLLHGTVFGVVFAFVLGDPILTKLTQWRWKSIVAGVVYGLVLTVVATGFILPVWLGAVGVSASPDLLFVTPELLGWHLLYGIILGVLFPEFEHRL